MVCGGLVFLFFVAPSLIAVFAYANAFNQDVSKWNTGAVTNMYMSKSNLFPSFCATASIVVFFVFFCIFCVLLKTTTRVLSDHSFHTFLFVFGMVYFFVASSSCSVLLRTCVQSGRVQMEYGCGDNYAKQ